MSAQDSQAPMALSPARAAYAQRLREAIRAETRAHNDKIAAERRLAEKIRDHYSAMLVARGRKPLTWIGNTPLPTPPTPEQIEWARTRVVNDRPAVRHDNVAHWESLPTPEEQETAEDARASEIANQLMNPGTLK